MVDIYNDKIDLYRQLVSDYSIFNVRDIGNVIASLIRTFEGINYIYYETQCETKKYKFLLPTLNKDVPTVVRFIKKIVTDKNNLNTYEKELVLSNTEKPIEKIQFYKVNKNQHVLESCMNYKEFDYVQKFID